MTAREKRLVETFVSLADTLVGDFDTSEFLYRLVERCKELFDVDQAGLVLADPGGVLHVMAATSETTHLMELMQIQNHEGPCLDCFLRGETVVTEDIGAQESRDRWPRFSEVLIEAGYRSVTALPMRLRDQLLGALNLFRSETGILRPADVSAAQAMADVATIGLIHERVVRDSRQVIEQLQGALNSRVLIEQAKGVVAQHVGVDIAQAFSLLRGYARENQIRLADVSRRVVDGEIVPTQLRHS